MVKNYRYNIYTVYGVELKKEPLKEDLSLDEVIDYIKTYDKEYIIHDFECYVDESQEDPLHEINIFDKNYTPSKILYTMDRPIYNEEYNKYEKKMLNIIKKELSKLKINECYYISCPWHDILRIK